MKWTLREGAHGVKLKKKKKRKKRHLPFGADYHTVAVELEVKLRQVQLYIQRGLIRAKPLWNFVDVSPRSVEARVGLMASPSRFSRNRGKKLLLKWQWNTCATPPCTLYSICLHNVDGIDL